jgi:outer membrane protein
MRKLITLIGSVAVSAMAASGAWAADVATKGPVMRAGAAPVEAWSPWMIRGRVLGVLPDSSATIDQVPNGSVKIDNSVVPELDITYFFTPNFAAEVILGVTPHEIHGAGALKGVEIGKAWLLPPTVTFQYHFTHLGAVKPYIGAGPNYTVFFNQEAAGGAVTQLDIKNSFGFALQAGVDIMLTGIGASISTSRSCICVLT